LVDHSEDFWADDDEDPDDEWHREEFPEGFRWDCCQKQGDWGESGCKTGRHKEDARRNAKWGQVVESAPVESITATAAADQPSSKRPGSLICVNPGCGADFDVLTNQENSCTWHTGKCRCLCSRPDQLQEC